MTATTTRRTPATGSEFAELNRRVNALGLMRRRPAYYVLRLVLVGLLASGGWAAFFVVGSSWWTLAVAALLAVAFAQLALVAHDLAHRQVFRTKGPSALAGRIAGNLGIGMSYGWGMGKHTPHPKNPKHDEPHPDGAPQGLNSATPSALCPPGPAGFVPRPQARV